MHIEGYDGAQSNSQLQGMAVEEKTDPVRPSATELRRQFSGISMSSVDSVSDLKLVESITNLKRSVYEVATTIL